MNVNGKNHILGESTSFYFAQNATAKLPEACNKVDTWIDTNKNRCGGVSFREKTFTFVQRTAGDKPDPVEEIANFIEELYERISIFEDPNTKKDDPKEKLTARFYAEVVADYKRQMGNGSRIFMKALFCKHNSKDPFDMQFYQKIQKQLNLQMIDESNRNAEARKLVIPTSPTKKIYERIWVVDAKLQLLLSKYFNDTNEAVLREDWENVQGATPAKTQKLSVPLREIFQQTTDAIKTTHALHGNPKHVGSIVQRILYDSSLTLKPGVAALYQKCTDTRKSARLAGKP